MRKGLFAVLGFALLAATFALFGAGFDVVNLIPNSWPMWAVGLVIGGLVIVVTSVALGAATAFAIAFETGDPE